MKKKEDIDVASMLAAMLESDGQRFQYEIPTCPGDGSPWTVGYPGCIEKSMAIFPLIMRYKFADVCKAAFCINSWHQNRSAQSCIVSLNTALISAEAFGENPITTYEDFKTFYRELDKLNLVSFREDYVIPVLGHTKLCFKGRWWPALHGCGMVHEYSRLCFANSICQEAGKSDEFESLLSYVASMTTLLEGAGWDGEEVGDIALHMPTASHWGNTARWFEESPYAQLPSDVLEVLSNKDKPVENAHFVKRADTTYPLFNPSILIDYLGFCCELLDTKALTGAVDSHLAFNADSFYTSNILDQSGLFLWPRFKLNDKHIENCPVSFMFFDDAGCLTLFYDLNYGDGNLKELRKVLIKRTPEVQAYESFKREKGYRRLRFGKQSIKEINLVAFVNDVAPVTMPSHAETSEVADITCGALDLLSILHASSSIEEINTYFVSLRKSKSKIVSGISGIFPHFWHWKDSSHNIFAGTEDISSHFNIFSEYNDNDLYYCNFFNIETRHYPFVDNTYPFGSPFRYRFEENDQGFVIATTKAEGKYVSESRRLGDKPHFLQLCADSNAGSNLTKEEFEREIEAYNISQNILAKLANDLEEEFGMLANACGGIVRFEYVCGASDKARYLDVIDKDLGICAKMLDASFGYVCYTFDMDRFLEALIHSTDRSVECRLGVAIVSSLRENYSVAENLVKAINSLRYEKKLVDMKAVEMPYVWHRSAGDIKETNISRKAAIKTVAIAADEAGIEPGAYRGKDANRMLRGFQDGLTNILKEKLGKYAAKTLIMDLYEVCGSASHEFFIHTNRIRSFTRIDEQEAHRLEDSTLDLREDAREIIRASRYCIETVLAFGLNGKEKPSAAELACVLSLAIQCLGVNDIADMFHFNPMGLSAEVEENKTVKIVEDDELILKSRDIKRRSLADPGHILEDSSVDINYLKRSNSAFKKDTGISFECFLCVLDELALGVESSEIFSFARPNVVSVPKEDLATHLSDSLRGHFEENDIRCCIEFLTIDRNALNVINGITLDYIPFGRVKDRPNRLQLKPLVSFEDASIYSPVCAGMLKKRWLEGIAQRFLPTKAYVSLYEVSRQWKEHYEKALEKDVRDCFLSHGFNAKHVFKGVLLHKHGNHPQNLGDYDGLAYDEKTETIWCIECKEFEKVESAFDSFQLQERWFKKKGKLQKFEKRVLYLTDHLDQIASDFNFQHFGALKIKPYLVCNKLFMNMIGESSFEVITLNELSKILDMRTEVVDSLHSVSTGKDL